MNRSAGNATESGNRRRGGSRFVLRRALALAALVAALAGCGYHLARPGNNLPQGIRRLAVPVFKNETMEPAIEAQLTDQLRRRFTESGWVRLTAVEEADALLVGSITQFHTSPISFSSTSFAAEYRAEMHVAVRLVDRQGVKLWYDPDLTKYREYQSAVDISQSEANKTVAISWLTQEVSRDVHDRIFDGFR